MDRLKNWKIATKAVEDPFLDHSTKPETFHKYAVNTECPLASKIGANILKNGGNAVDAAIATTITIGIMNSFSSGIGGGGFMIIKHKGKEVALDFREQAPKNISMDFFRENPEKLTTSLMSVCIPGELKGLYEAHKRFGKMSWENLFTENIELCFKGFKATGTLVSKLKRCEEYIFKDEGLRNVYTKNGKLVQEGDIIYRTKLGETLRIISKDPNSFYEGALADRIATFFTKNGGIITKEDLRNYRVEERKVVKGKFMGFNVTAMSIPTSGPFVLLGLKILQNFELEKMKLEFSPENEFMMHYILIETFKFMFSERGEVEDPAFLKNTDKIVNQIISDENALHKFNALSLEFAKERDYYRKVKPFVSDNGTTHLNIIDEDGMAVLLTSSVNLEFGSKIMDPDTGIIFNNTIDDFLIPGHSNFFGLISEGLNVLEPGKRPFSSASPVILENENEMILIGAAGGTRIPTSILSTILYFYVFGDMKKAVAHYRIHDQIYPATTFVESTFPSQIMQQLISLGQSFKISATNTTFTSVNAIYVRKNEHKSIIAISDERKNGLSCGE